MALGNAKVDIVMLFVVNSKFWFQKLVQHFLILALDSSRKTPCSSHLVHVLLRWWQFITTSRPSSDILIHELKVS